jgi:glycosyltransferase involved in cell wall biosynthesis
MKILHVISSLNPAGGGPAAHLHALAPVMAGLGHPTEIVALDRPGDPRLAAIRVPVHTLGPARLGYAYAARLLPWLRAEARRFDAVIVHGQWQYLGLATHLAMARGGPPRHFAFPHGMLDPWFNRQYPLKHAKKWLYWWLAERRILAASAAVLFTCEEERRLARQSFPGSSYRECVVTYGTAAPPDCPDPQRAAFLQLQPALRDQPFWLFLGRIHRKKNIEHLLAAYARLAAPGAPLPRLVIAGPCADAGYLRRLQAQAAAACPAGAVLWPGMLAGNAKWGALRAAEAFVLPSHQENFGIAVVEALACGTPVLISDQVNIWREIAADGAGLVEPDTAAGVFRLLSRWHTLATGARRGMAAAAAPAFLRRYEIGAVARSLLAALQAFLPAQPSS